MTTYSQNINTDILFNGLKIKTNSFLYNYCIEFLRGRFTEKEFYGTLARFPAKISQDTVDTYLEYVRLHEINVKDDKNAKNIS